MDRILYVPHNSIDKIKWDECLENASNSLIYGFSNFLDIMSPNWDALILNDYEAVMPLTQNRKFGIRYLRQPAFTQQLGIFGNGPFHPQLVEQFLNKAAEKFKLIEINLNFENKYEDTSASRCNLILPLNKSFSEIKENFRKDLITQSKQAGLKYAQSENIEEAIGIFKNYYSRKIPHLNSADFVKLFQLCQYLQSENKLLIRKVNSSAGNLLTVALFYKDERRIYYLLSATLSDGRKYDSNAFLLHEIIREFSGQNLLFDFEGSEIPSIQFFFKKFAPVEQPYYFVRRDRLPFWVNWGKRILKK